MPFALWFTHRELLAIKKDLAARIRVAPAVRDGIIFGKLTGVQEDMAYATGHLVLGGSRVCDVQDSDLVLFSVQTSILMQVPVPLAPRPHRCSKASRLRCERDVGILQTLGKCTKTRATGKSGIKVQ